LPGKAVRAAIFQSAGGGLTPGQRLASLSDALSSTATSARPDLVVCPELFLSGYNTGNDIDDLAQPADGAWSKQMADLASTHRTAIVYGFPERSGDRIHNSAACVSQDGETLALHHKLLIPPGFEQQHFTPGHRTSLFDLCGLRCAMLICYDAEFPESVRATAVAGAQVVIVPTALSSQWGVVAQKLIPTRAFENGVWLIYANHAGKENGLTYLGQSCIVAPDGSDAARAGAGVELIWAEVNAESVVRAQDRLPYLKDRAVLMEVLGG
jgi:predicted amidohydrolase